MSTPGNTGEPGNTNTPGGTNSPVEIDGGLYEGEWDANGKRSGYGVWLYHNYRYEGYWENDMPNGEGTLYSFPYAQWGNTSTMNIIQGNTVSVDDSVHFPCIHAVFPTFTAP